MTVMARDIGESFNMNDEDVRGQLHIGDFPKELHRRLRIIALESGVTFRDLIVSVLRAWAFGARSGNFTTGKEPPLTKPVPLNESKLGEKIRGQMERLSAGVANGAGQAGGVKRAQGVSGVRGGVLDGEGAGGAGKERVAADSGTPDRAPGDGRAVDGSLRKDQGETVEDILGEPEW